jgi:DNA-binding NtrC family response regulator
VYSFDVNILIVDDDPDILEVIGKALRDAGFTVDMEETAHAALSKISQKKFDLVIADIHLTECSDGIRMILKARERHPNLKCVFISGWYDPVVCDPEIDEFIEKPFRPDELVGCVLKVLTGNVPYPRVARAKRD